MQLTLLFLVGLFVVRCEAEAPLPVRLAFRNVTASSTSSSSPSSSDQNECNIISLTILSSGDTIYLRESSTNIIHPSIITKEQSTNNTSGSQICLYQEMSYNASRLVSVSSTNNQISVYISINGSSYSIDNVSMALTTDVIELEPVQQQAQFRAPGGSCGVQSNESNVFDKRAEALTLSYVNNEIKDYYVEMYLVVDCDFYQRYRSNYFSYIAQILNYVNAIYRSQGIHIFVTALEVWSSFNRFTVSSDSELTLQNLVNYRSTLTQSHDVIHLLSGKTFDNNFGRAFINGLCIYSNSAGLVAGGAGYSALLTAAVMAHILGHNFGLEHDTAGCTCTPDAYCIMSTYFPPTPPQRFSTCTQSAFNKNLPFYQATSCLANLPSLPNSISLNTCGNGIVDAGEDCDPGLWDTTAACCDPVTCRFRPGARCASGRCCNKITCRPLMPATLCRQADNECDLPEYCDGISENCPDDRYKMSATLCDNNKMFVLVYFDVEKKFSIVQASVIIEDRGQTCTVLWETKNGVSEILEATVKGRSAEKPFLVSQMKSILADMSSRSILREGKRPTCPPKRLGYDPSSTDDDVQTLNAAKENIPPSEDVFSSPEVVLPPLSVVCSPPFVQGTSQPQCEQTVLSSSVHRSVHADKGSEKWMVRAIAQLRLENKEMDERLKRLEALMQANSGGSSDVTFNQIVNSDSLNHYQEKVASDLSFRTSLVKWLSVAGGTEVSDTLHNCVNRLMSLEVQRFVNQSGFRGKIRLCPLDAVIFDAVRITQPQASISQLNATLQKFLAGACDRGGGRKRRFEAKTGKNRQASGKYFLPSYHLK